MDQKVSLCALHEGYDWMLPLAGTTNSKTCFSASLLSPQESKWRDIYHYLFDRGLELRPRYSPGWIPSWLGTDLVSSDCEDRIRAFVCPYSAEEDLSYNLNSLCFKSFLWYWTPRSSRIIKVFALR